jgi:hypothetical protein
VQAAGSSLLTRICHFLVVDALHEAGLHEVASVQVFPLATGMAMTTAFLACASARSQNHVKLSPRCACEAYMLAQPAQVCSMSLKVHPTSPSCACLTCSNPLLLQQQRMTMLRA